LRHDRSNCRQVAQSVRSERLNRRSRPSIGHFRPG
jgi:hypothetical protein